MGDRETAHTALGILGNIASGLFFLSSAPTIVRIVRCKSSGGISGDLYVFKLFNCMLWCLYGIPYVHPHDVWVVLTNSFGCTVASTYIFAYICFATRREKIGLVWKVCATLISFTSLVVLLVLFSRSQWQRVLVVGIMSAVVSSGMHVTLLSQCRTALQLRDEKFLHPVESIAGFLKGATWSAYGLVNLDLFILIPNGVGVCIGVIQALVVLFLVRSGTATSNDANEEVLKDTDSKQIRSSGHNVLSCEAAVILDAIQGTQPGSTPFPSVSRASSWLGPPRQASITSSVVVPVVVIDLQNPSANELQS